MAYKYKKYIGLVHNAFDVSASSRLVKRIIAIFVDVIIIPSCMWAAIALRFSDPTPNLNNIFWIVVAAPLVSIPVFYTFGLYRSMLRYMGIQVAWSLAKGMTVSTLILAALVYFTHSSGIPRSVFIIYFCLGMLFMGGSRIVMRAYLLSILRLHQPKKPVIIYGAGASGVQLATVLVNATDTKVVAFVDDDKAIQGNLIHGVKVFKPEKLKILVSKYNVKQILLAMPSVNQTRRRDLLHSLEKFAVHVRTVPGMEDLVSGKSSVEEIKDIDVLDLLGRDSVPLDSSLLKERIENKVVMVTGAGGFIGSELCRQIIALNPETVVLLEHSEHALYKIEQDLTSKLRKINSPIKLTPILGSVQNKLRLSQIMKACNVHTIYHTAAYKYVSLVELNVVETVRNNIFGISCIAETAIENNVESVVLISEDKAAHPTHLMGASKRFAELILLAYSNIANTKTNFCVVRFGSVLGATGSVVRLFREQILTGGPVTVSHPEISRYFMTVDEAAQLIIQASSLGEGGDIFSLNMGEPVKILSLAYRMIRLMGFDVKDETNIGSDIEVKFTGLRLGEQLTEDLLVGNNVTMTHHSRIQRVEEATLAFDEIEKYLFKLNIACNQQECEDIFSILKDAIKVYSSSKDLVKLKFNLEYDDNNNNAQLSNHADKVVPLKAK